MTSKYLPIIMLHHVDDHPHESIAPYTLSRRKFDLLLNYIEDHGYQTTTFEDLVLDQNANLHSKKKIVLTFDDCPTPLFEYAIPELLRRKMKAVFYLPTAYIGTYNVWDVEGNNMAKVTVMDETQIKQLVSLGMEVGTHSDRHIKLSQVSPKVAFEEMHVSKNKLESIVGKSVYSIAFPFGEIPTNFKKTVGDAGYKYGLAIYSPEQHPYSLRRVGIVESDNHLSLAFKLSTAYNTLRTMAYPIYSLKVKIFGNAKWKRTDDLYKIWALFIKIAFIEYTLIT
ncbi:MAG: hypothetical protein EOO42_12095 [Flavobacteriales bacterium]|nr:MAG: hypothetical protein EOO42_12095 [Flavobacteriales bacterium]